MILSVNDAVWSSELLALLIHWLCSEENQVSRENPGFSVLVSTYTSFDIKGHIQTHRKFSMLSGRRPRNRGGGAIYANSLRE